MTTTIIRAAIVDPDGKRTWQEFTVPATIVKSSRGKDIVVPTHDFDGTPLSQRNIRWVADAKDGAKIPPGLKYLADLANLPDPQ